MIHAAHDVSPSATRPAMTSDALARRSGGHHTGSVEFLHPLNDGGVVRDLNVCTHPLQFGDITSSISENGFGQHAATFGTAHQRHQLRFMSVGKPGWGAVVTLTHFTPPSRTMRTCSPSRSRTMPTLRNLTMTGSSSSNGAWWQNVSASRTNSRHERSCLDAVGDDRVIQGRQLVLSIDVDDRSTAPSTLAPILLSTGRALRPPAHERN